MAILKYEPINILNELNSFLENSFHRRDDSAVETSRWLPSVDIKNGDNQYHVFADLPGVDAKDIEISMENNVLTLKGTRSEVNKEERKNYYRSERIQGEFYRRFTLPDDADGEAIKAVTKNGVLEITIPKKKVATSRRIEVETQS